MRFTFIIGLSHRLTFNKHSIWSLILSHFHRFVNVLRFQESNRQNLLQLHRLVVKRIQTHFTTHDIRQLHQICWELISNRICKINCELRFVTKISDLSAESFDVIIRLR